MKEWKVRFKKLMDKQWTVTERPFKSKDAAEFFVQTVNLMSPYKLEVEAFEEEVCPKISN